MFPGRELSPWDALFEKENVGNCVKALEIMIYSDKLVLSTLFL
jgi:hypothetical protein